jgi:hypothetical protein
MELDQYWYSGMSGYYGNPVPQSLGSFSAICILPTEGPGSDYVVWEYFTTDDGDGYENDWQNIEVDLYDAIDDAIFGPGGLNEVVDPPYDYIPDFQIGWFVLAQGVVTEKNINVLPDDPDGGCTNALNPVPWTGLMLDRIDVSIIDVDRTTLEDVMTVETGELQPMETETFQMSWTSELCAHVLTAETRLPGDVNPTNDACCEVITHTIEEERCFNHSVEDLTGGGECLWHVCTNREEGDDYFAWAGKESEHSAQYVNNMDDSLVSPSIDLSDYKDEGVMINYSYYCEMADNDFVEFDIWRTFDHDGDDTTANITKWYQLKRYGRLQNTGGSFAKEAIFVPEADVPEHPTKLRFRIWSDDSGVDEGFYVDDIQITNVTDDGDPGTLASTYFSYSDGWTENAIAWVDGTAAMFGVELSQIELGAFSGMDVTEMVVSIGADDYPSFVEPCDYELYVQTTVPPFTGGTPVATGTTDGLTVWQTLTCPPVPVPGSGSLYVVVKCSNYGGNYPMGLDDTTGDTTGRAALLYDHYDVWGTCAALLGYFGVWGIDVGFDSSGPPPGIVFGDPIAAFPWDLPDPTIETWERGTIAPWICEPGEGGQHWMKWSNRFDTSTLPNGESDYYHDVCGCTEGWYTMPSENLVPWGYGATGTGINNAIAFELDLTDELLDPYIKFSAAMNYNFVNERAYIEFSPDWDGESSMETATWTVYWCHTPGDEYGDSTGGWMTLDEILAAAGHQDDRFVIDEYLGEKVYVRFRLETDGNGAAIGEGWALDDIHLKVKHTGVAFHDDEAPVTSIFFNQETAKVTLVAQDYPLDKGVGVDATYYKVDGGATETYGGPFTLPEGTHSVEYWSVDHNGNEESHKSASYVVDTTAPTVTLVKPEEGKLYLFGSPIMNRILSTTTLCIGRVPIEAEADDGDGSGIARVLFNINGDSGWDGDDPYEYEYSDMHFGDLTISAISVDNVGLMSDPDEMTVKCFSLGLL